MNITKDTLIAKFNEEAVDCFIAAWSSGISSDGLVDDEVAALETVLSEINPYSNDTPSFDNFFDFYETYIDKYVDYSELMTTLLGHKSFYTQIDEYIESCGQEPQEVAFNI